MIIQFIKGIDIMKQLKHYGKVLLLFLGSSILLSLLLSILNYFGIFVGKTSQIILIIYMLIITFYIGYSSGKLALKNGYLKGLKIGGILILTLIFLNMIFFWSPLTIYRVLYYLIILIISIVSAMIGINRKTNGS